MGSIGSTDTNDAANVAQMGLGFGPYAQFGNFYSSLRTLLRLACGDPPTQLFSDLVRLACISNAKEQNSTEYLRPVEECPRSWTMLYFASFEVLITGCVVQLVVAVAVLEFSSELSAAQAVEAAVEPLSIWIDRWLVLCQAEHVQTSRRCSLRPCRTGVAAAKASRLPADQL